MLRGSHADAHLAPEVTTALGELLVSRSRVMMRLCVGAVIVFIVATHVIGTADRWSDLMNVAVGALLVASLRLSRLPIVHHHIVLPCVLLFALLGALRALAGIPKGNVVGTALFLVVLAIVLAAILPWGMWPQLAVACAFGGAAAANAHVVIGELAPDGGRAAANVVLGLASSVILAAETRRHHTRLFVNGFKRRDAEAALARLNAELEHRIAERTADLQRAQQAALQHQADLAHVLRLGTMGEIAAGLAHEINQPLGAIANYALGGARRLRTGTVDRETLLPIMEKIGAEALRAGEIIRWLRDLVRKDDGRRVRADLNHLVRESIRRIEPEAQARNVALQLKLAPVLPTILCNEIQIEQVLINLLLNSVESVERVANGERVLSVRTALAGDTAEVAVYDSGVGLPELPEQVFAPFYTTKPAGLGMGLSISRSIVEAHGGRLWGAANPDRGATFHLTLPVA